MVDKSIKALHLTSHQAKKLKIFMISNLVFIILLVAGASIWMWNAHKHDNFPYNKFLRRTGPPGSVPYPCILDSTSSTCSEVKPPVTA